MSQNGKRPTCGACLTSKQKDEMLSTSKTQGGKRRWADGEELRVSQSDFLPAWGRMREACVKRAATNPKARQKKPEQASNPAGATQPFSERGSGARGKPSRLQPRKRSVTEKHSAAGYKNRKASFASRTEFPVSVKNITPSLMWKRGLAVLQQGQARGFKDRDQRNTGLKGSSRAMDASQQAQRFRN